MKLLAALLSLQLAFGAVVTQRTPDGGIQPQVAMDAEGTVHLIYYKGEAAAGDVYYTWKKAGDEGFSKPLQVNSRAGTAMAAGSIRGAQLAVGKGSRVHVVWNGMKADEVLYTRLNDAGTGFEPERNVIQFARGLDGGSSIAADPLGNVYATWHGRAPGAAEGEAGRAVFVARSADEGKTFAREFRAAREETGACGCCGMKAFADRAGAVYILYRGAAEKVNRDEALLVSPKPGAPFEIANKHSWQINTCPMSSAFFAPSSTGVLAAWETDGQVFFTRVNGVKLGKIIAPPGAGKRKHPVAAENKKGEILLAWTEETAWAKGGFAAWQVFDKNGVPLLEQGRVNGVPVWSLVAAYTQPNGDFVVVY